MYRNFVFSESIRSLLGKLVKDMSTERKLRAKQRRDISSPPAVSTMLKKRSSES
ncbi:hypothetical protein J2X02_000935 [Pseudoxanthomonas japonensis]|nr:hypothetical protein [Pseudoxanthomonas japonensis]